MHIETLQICHFRNITQAAVELDPGFNVFYGDNAQGKSNILEAAYALAFLKGFRSDKPANLIEFDQPCALLGARLHTQNAHIQIGLELTAHGRRPQIDGTPCRRLRDFLGVLRVILFVPSDVAILQAPPADRRTMLDRMIFTRHPAYLPLLDQYQKIFKQKSALLKRPETDPAVLDTFDEQLKEAGKKLIRARYEFLQALAPFIQEMFKKIFDDTFHCALTYKSATCQTEVDFSSNTAPSLQCLIQNYESVQKQCRAHELRTTLPAPGPHRDDWSILINNRQAKCYASQGQQRAISLAVKMAEITFLKHETGIDPVFLLDDVTSELDPVRHKKLFQALNELTSQVLLTTTSKNHVHIDKISKLFNVREGKITHDP